MIEFKNNVNEILPYDRMKYLSRRVKWHGVSFQLPGGFEGREIGLTEYFEKYEDWFKKMVSKLDTDSFWIVNHDRKGTDWFPNDEDNLISLRMLFKQNAIPNTFQGALIFTKDDLLKLSRDLISYPYAVFDEAGLLYDNLDISHSELPFIIKITGHWDIHLLSTNKKLLRNIVHENISDSFIIKEYKGTSIL